MQLPNNSSKLDVAVIVPIFNEELILDNSISTIVSTLENVLIYYRWILLIVDDGSKDKSPEIAQILAKENKERIVFIRNDVNAGYGSAIRTGITFCSNNDVDFAVCMDVDLTNPPSEVLSIVEKLSEGFDLVKANRWGNKGSKGGNFRMTLSFIARSIALLFVARNVKDPTNGFRGVRISSYPLNDVNSDGFSSIIQEWIQFTRLGLRCTSFESELGVREGADNKSHFSYDIGTLWSYLSPILSYRLTRSFR